MLFRKCKSALLIFLIVSISFTLYIPKVKAQQQECCEQTKDGAFCVYTDVSNCVGQNHAPAFCEDTSFCTLGCCFDSDTGECFSNTAQSECRSLEGTWEASANCNEVAQCATGCCQLNNQAFLSTLTKCKQVASQFSGTEPNFDASIQDEFSCVNSVRSAETGCCVQEDSCSFITRSECGLGESALPIATGEEVEEEIIPDENKAIGFYPGTLCSLDSLGCDAVKQHNLGCYQGDVYWFDSEGNPENVFLGEAGEGKTRSYNNGRTLTDPGCIASPNDPNCGNCEYSEGTLCAEKDDGPTCIDLDCRETQSFEFATDAGGSKQLGQSWCIYDGPIGSGQDRPGSRHFRASCINGEETIEACADFREEFCTQSYANGEPMTEYGSFLQKATSIFPAQI